MPGSHKVRGHPDGATLPTSRPLTSSCSQHASSQANFPCPTDLKTGMRHAENIQEVNARAGDVVIFTETMYVSRIRRLLGFLPGNRCNQPLRPLKGDAHPRSHGALPWNAAHDRRTLAYKFSPGHSGYSAGVGEVSYPDWVEDMTPEQRLVMARPFVRMEHHAEAAATGAKL